MKNKKKLRGFSLYINIVNFEVLEIPLQIFSVEICYKCICHANIAQNYSILIWSPCRAFEHEKKRNYSTYRYVIPEIRLQHPTTER